MDTKKMILGTRGSELAMWQANRMKELLLKANPGIEIEIKTIKTKGDIVTEVPLGKIGDEGLFTKALEDELILGRIDVAVHSCKDLPTKLANELYIAAYPEREDPRDMLISFKANKLIELDMKARVGTSSLRRKAFLTRLRPDLTFLPLRGNIDTRINKLKDDEMDAVIMASAAVKRLNIKEAIAEIFESSVFVPAVGQGIIALEMRKDGKQRELVKKIDDPKVRICAQAERSLLRTLNGGCQVPIGCYAQVENGRLGILAAVSSLDGKRYIEKTIEGDISDPERLGADLAKKIIDDGADEILDEIRQKK